MENLKRQFGPWTAIAMIVGQVIGVGIFLTPAGMARSVGSPAVLFAIWLVIGFITLCGALCFGELAARFPNAGGIYVYLREAFGRVPAFLYGWMVLLVLDPGLTAVFGVAVAAYAGFLIPLNPSTQTALAIGLILLFGIINILGVRLGAQILKILTLLKVTTLLFIIIYGFGGGLGSFENFKPFFAVPNDIFGALAGGTVGAFFAFAGWWEVTRIAGEIKEPERNVPRALISGVAILTLIYLLTSAAFMYLVPVAAVISDETFAAQAGEAMFGAIGGPIFAAVVVLSVSGTLFAYLMACPRVYYAMANDGLFFSTFGKLHPRFGTPHRATLIQMTVGSLLILTGSFNEIISYFFFVVVLFVAVTILGLFRIRKQEFDGYKTPMFPATPIIFIALVSVVLFFIAMSSPLQSGIGVAVVLFGIPFYYFIGGIRNR